MPRRARSSPAGSCRRCRSRRPRSAAGSVCAGLPGADRSGRVRRYIGDASMPASLNRLEPFTYGAIAIVGGALTAGLAYLTSPLVPFAAIAVAAVAILTAYWPLGTLYLAILTVPFKLVTIDFGGAGLAVAEALFGLSRLGWAPRRVISGSWPVVPSPPGRPYAFLL